MPLDIVKRYLQLFPEEAAALKPLMDKLIVGEALNDRTNFSGHITGAGAVLSPNRDKILLVHHVAMDLWILPGGHSETDEPNPFEAAKRETTEETSVKLGAYLAVDKDPMVPLMLEMHAIPANPARDEPAHSHYGFCYVWVATSLDLQAENAGVDQVGWYDFDDAQTANVRPVIDKLRSQKFIM